MDYIKLLDSPDATFIYSSGQHCASLFNEPALAALSASQKHKLTVKVSTLLKSKGAQRAFGTWLVATLLEDQEIVKSNAASWCPILLHMLDLPDNECWAGAIKALCILYSRADLRDLGSSAKIGDFVKRLVAILPSAPVPASRALRFLLNRNPGSLRSYIPKITAQLHSIMWSSCWQDLLQLLAALTLAEKAPAAAWREQLIAILSDCASLPAALKALPQPPIASHRVWAAAEKYILCRPQGAKLPTQRLIAALDSSLKTSPESAHAALKFMARTSDTLGRVYLLHFDDILHLCCEASNYSSCLEPALEVVTMLLNEVKTLPQKYNKTVESLFNKAYKTVTNPSAVDARDLELLLAHLAASTILASETIPASFRSKIDAAALRAGGDQLRVATLYPGRFSLLPISLNNGNQLLGYETLVHPRFPPLAIGATAGTAQMQPTLEPEEDLGPARVQITRIAPTEQPVPTEVSEPVLPDIELDAVPQAKREDEAEAPLGERPEKRQKVADDNQHMPAVQAPSVVEADQEDDDDDDMVIPELELDSD